MKTLLVSALALGALTSTTFAEPVKLTSAQMDGVTAGQFEQSVTFSQMTSNTFSSTASASGTTTEASASGEGSTSSTVSITVSSTTPDTPEN